MLTTGYSDDSHMLVSRLLDTGIGIRVGLLVNLVVWPPLRDGAAVSGADRDAIEAVRTDLDAFAGELDVDELQDGFWPISGALLVNLRNILAALDVVADAQPVKVASPALARR